MNAAERIQQIIATVKADIATHERLLAECDTESGRAYQQQEIDRCRKQLARREAMLASEIEN